MSALDKLVAIEPAGTPLTAMQASPHKLAEAMTDYLIMERELAKTVEENRRLQRDCDSHMNEALLLRDQLKTMTSNFLSVQAYANELTTRIDVCVEVMAKAKSEAARFGVKSLEAKNTDGVSEKDSDNLKSILDRLPHQLSEKTS